MYTNLDMFRTALSMAQHAGARQALVATNIANADTPGYKARSLPAFSDIANAGDSVKLRATRAGHMDAEASSFVRVKQSGGEPAPNGNDVSIEVEMLNAVAIEREHNRALAIYRHSLGVLRSSMGR